MVSQAPAAPNAETTIIAVTPTQTQQWGLPGHRLGAGVLGPLLSSALASAVPSSASCMGSSAVTRAGGTYGS